MKSSTQKAAERQIEEQLYAQVAKELSEGMHDHGIQAKSLAEAEGNTEKAKGLYIKYRVQSIKDELILKEEFKVRLKEEQEKESIKVQKEKELIEKQAAEINNYLENEDEYDFSRGTFVALSTIIGLSFLVYYLLRN